MILGLAQMSQAANYPCSGKKGGVARCDGALWLCNDGSISASKRNCSAVYGASSTPLRATDNLPSECPCGTGVLCIGPRGGQYCITASGNKSYKRK
jgi:hypothetical protein